MLQRCARSLRFSLLDLIFSLHHGESYLFPDPSIMRIQTRQPNELANSGPIRADTGRRIEPHYNPLISLNIISAAHNTTLRAPWAKGLTLTFFHRMPGRTMIFLPTTHQDEDDDQPTRSLLRSVPGCSPSTIFWRGAGFSVFCGADVTGPLPTMRIHSHQLAKPIDPLIPFAIMIKAHQ